MVSIAEMFESTTLQNTSQLSFWLIFPVELTLHEVETAAREVFRQRHVLYELYAQATGQPSERIAEDSARRVFMLATEAQAYGLIDHIR
jgi:ATP-dependent protease ClpP protease subunit